MRTLDQFWPFIQGKFPTYKARRAFILQAFDALLNRLDSGQVTPAEDMISNGLLSAFSTEEVGRCWKKMLDRARHDPDGAITASRTLIETVLKHILDALNEAYDTRTIELPELYKKVQLRLNLAPEQHQSTIVKQILGGCSGVVNGLGALRNQLGDAHGGGVSRKPVEQRHANLAVNLAGSMALFLTETFTKHHDAKTTL